MLNARLFQLGNGFGALRSERRYELDNVPFRLPLAFLEGKFV